MKRFLLSGVLFFIGLICLAQQPHAQFNGCQAGFCSKVAAATTTAWDPAHTDAQSTLSPDHLTLTTAAGSFAQSATRSVASHGTGKYFSQHLIVTDSGFAGFIGVGIFNSSNSLTNSFAGGGGGGASFGYNGDGTVVICTQGTPLATIQTFAQGNTVGQAIDFDNHKGWWQVNGGNWNNDIIANQNPVTNTGGISFAAITGCTGPTVYFAAMSQLVFTATAQQSTANFGPTPITNFVNW